MKKKIDRISRKASSLPPYGLKAKELPQLISFTFDDNTYSGLPASGAEGGLHFITEELSSHGAAGTIYLKGNNIAENQFEDDSLVKKACRQAYEKGFEFASHTYSHPHGLDFIEEDGKTIRKPILTKEQWIAEIEKFCDTVSKPWNENVKEHESQYGLGIKASEIIGHRTPFLEYNDGLFSALEELGIEYEAATEEGWEPDQDGSNFFWPYTLDEGCFSENWVAENFFDHSEPLIGKHPGLWILPCYVMIVPPDDKCLEYGTQPGFRARMKKANPWFDEASGKITGVDWNIWFEYFMNKEDALAVLKYSFDLRYYGNRCPWPLAFHSDIYSDKYDKNDLEDEDPANIKADAAQRREVFKAFLDYVASKPDTKILTSAQMLEWLKKLPEL